MSKQAFQVSHPLHRTLCGALGVVLCLETVAFSFLPQSAFASIQGRALRGLPPVENSLSADLPPGTQATQEEKNYLEMTKWLADAETVTETFSAALNLKQVDKDINRIRKYFATYGSSQPWNSGFVTGFGHSHTEEGEVYEQLLRRSALKKLAETAFVLAVVADTPGPFMESFGTRERFPGLDAHIEMLRANYQESFSNPKKRSQTQHELYDMLIANGLMVDQLSSAWIRTQLDFAKVNRKIEDRIRAAKAEDDSKELVLSDSDPDKIELVQLTKRRTELFQLMNQLVSSNPLMMMLALNVDGPSSEEESAEAKIDRGLDPIDRYFALRPELLPDNVVDGVPLFRSIGERYAIHNRIAKATNSGLESRLKVMLSLQKVVKKAVQKWAPVIAKLVRDQKLRVLMEDPFALLANEGIRFDALEINPENPLFKKIADLDELMMVKGGYAPAPDTGESAASRRLKAGGFFVASVGATVAMGPFFAALVPAMGPAAFAKAVGDWAHDSEIRRRVVFGSVLGWSSFGSLGYMHQHSSGVKLGVGLMHAGFVTLVSALPGALAAKEAASSVLVTQAEFAALSATRARLATLSAADDVVMAAAEQSGLAWKLTQAQIATSNASATLAGVRGLSEAERIAAIAAVDALGASTWAGMRAASAQGIVGGEASFASLILNKLKGRSFSDAEVAKVIASEAGTTYSQFAAGITAEAALVGEAGFLRGAAKTVADKVVSSAVSAKESLIHTTNMYSRYMRRFGVARGIYVATKNAVVAGLMNPVSVNAGASGITFLASSYLMAADNAGRDWKDFGDNWDDLMANESFYRDFVFTLVSDATLAYYTGNSSFVKTGLVMSAVLFVDSVGVSMYLGREINMERLLCEVGFIALFSNAKYRYMFGPIGKGVQNSLLAGIKASRGALVTKTLAEAQKTALRRQIMVMKKLAVVSSLTSLLVSNQVGNHSYVLLAGYYDDDVARKYLKLLNNDKMTKAEFEAQLDELVQMQLRDNPPL